MIAGARSGRSAARTGPCHQSISSPVSSTKTSSRFAGRRSPSDVAVAPSCRAPRRSVPVRRVRRPGRARLGLDLGEPRRRAVDLDRLAPGVLGDQLGRRADRDGAAVRHDQSRCRRGARPPRCSASTSGSSVPSLRSASISAQSSWRTCGSRPTVGSSSSTSRGRWTSARAISSRRRMPPESLSTRVSRRSRRLAISSARSIAARRSARGDAVEVREDEQVLLDGQRHVEVVELRDDAALRARLLRLAGQRVAEHLELALVGDRLRGEHAHRRRLAGAVRAEQADARPLRDVEVEAVDGGDLRRSA